MKRICRKIVPAVYLVIFTGLFIFHITLTYKIPNVAELRLNREKGEGITLGELDRSLPDGCSFYSEKDAGGIVLYAPRPALYLPGPGNRHGECAFYFHR